MHIRTRAYHYFFAGTQLKELLVYETISYLGVDFKCVKREFGLKFNSPSLKRLIKVLALCQEETSIQVGIDGWSIQVWSETRFKRCLSNSPKVNSRSSSTDKKLIVDI